MQLKFIYKSKFIYATSKPPLICIYSIYILHLICTACMQPENAVEIWIEMI